MRQVAVFFNTLILNLTSTGKLLLEKGIATISEDPFKIITAFVIAVASALEKMGKTGPNPIGLQRERNGFEQIVGGTLRERIAIPKEYSEDDDRPPKRLRRHEMNRHRNNQPHDLNQLHERDG